MADVVRILGDGPGWRGEAVAAVEGVLRSYSQVFYSRSRRVGLVLLLATALAPMVAAHGLLAVLLAHGMARALGFATLDLREGFFGYNALLVGLGIGALLEPGLGSLGLVVVASAASLGLAAAARSVLGGVFALPMLTLPFVGVLWLSLTAAGALGLPRASGALDPVAISLPLPELVVRLAEGMGALFFVPHLGAGLVVLLAMLIYSRHGTLLAAIGLGLAALLATWLGPASAGLHQTLAFNMSLTAIALGGVWFVPGPAATLFGAAGAAVAGLVTLGMVPLLARFDLPVVVAPMNLVVLGALVAMRQRLHDGRPKVVDFLPGSPEANLQYYRTRVARFGGFGPVRIHAPFLGRWVVTQGERGAYTHQGAWQSALDFEVQGADGEVYRGQGTSNRDFLCWRLPVLACADGTVVRVVDAAPDTAPGEADLEQPWGNVVVLWHAAGLYSVVAHLAAGSVVVREGQVVRQGETLARCGSSGRSPVPHLHFQLQGSPLVGAPTLPMALHDVILEGEGSPRLCTTVVPLRGQVLRNVEPQADVAHLLSLPLSGTLRLRYGAGAEAAASDEEVVLHGAVGLLGDLSLSTLTPGATLHYSESARMFTVLDVVGPRTSPLRVLQAALARVPFEAELEWTDFLAMRGALPVWLRMLLDPVEPYLPARGLELRYSSRREGKDLVITGVSARTDADGRPWVQTRAVLRPEVGLHAAHLTLRGRTRHVGAARPAAASPLEPHAGGPP